MSITGKNTRSFNVAHLLIHVNLGNFTDLHCISKFMLQLMKLHVYLCFCNVTLFLSLSQSPFLSCGNVSNGISRMFHFPKHKLYQNAHGHVGLSRGTASG